MMVQPLAHGEPQVISRYRILGVLGAGGMGRVLLGSGPDGRLVAVKQVHPHLLDHREYRARFQREVVASTRVSGAFTAPVVDFDVDGDVPWLASLFVHGLPLDQVIEEHGPLPVPAVLALTAGLTVALQDIHRAGIVHRDLKPANVLLTSDGPRVIDFGIAQMMENSGGLTETGSMLGSPAYMSPEQTLAESITPASDIFSLGSLLVLAATGSSPFATSSLPYTLFQIAHTEPDLARVPSELRGLLEACLRKDPRQRPTPEQLLQYLGRQSDGAAPWPAPVRAAIGRQERFLAGVATDPNATLAVSRGAWNRGLRTGTNAPEPRSRRRTAGRAGLAGLTVAAVVAAGLTWMHHADGSDAPQANEPALAELRDIDSCAWLRQAIIGSTPENSVWSADPATWKVVPWSAWDCSLKAGDQRLTVVPGDDLGVMYPIGGTVEGLRLLGGTDSTNPQSCDRGVDLAGAKPQWGITVSLSNAENCDFAVKVLARLIATRSSAPKRTDSASLGNVDVCALMPRDLVNGIVPPVPQLPSKSSAHRCEWQGSSAVRATMTLSSTTAQSIDKSVDLGEGRNAIVKASSVASYCTLRYPYRTVADLQEMVEVEIRGGDDDTEKHCKTAVSILRAVIDNLPKAK